jgi:hypothetical protein
MGLFDLLFGNGSTDDYYVSAGDPDRAQASADYQAAAGGWHQPDPPQDWRDFDHRPDGGWW